MTANLATIAGRRLRAVRRRGTAADLSLEVNELAGRMRGLIERMTAGSGGLPREWGDVARRFRNVAGHAAQLRGRLARTTWAGDGEIQRLAALEGRVEGLAEWAEAIATVERAVPGAWPDGSLEEDSRRRIRDARAFVLSHPPSS